jgi:methionine-rich copper-binding protein CopC
MMKSLVVKLSLLALLFAAACNCAFSQSLALAPAQIIEDFKPGVPFEYSLALENKGNEASELHVQVTDFWYNDKNEKVFGAPGTSPRSAANWIQFVPDKFEVPAGGSQKMKAIVTPPADARGGYYAVLFIESKPIATNKKTEDGKRVFTNMRLGCLVLLTAKNTEAYNVSLNDLKLVPPSDTQGLQLTFSLDNESNTHVFPQAKLAILNPAHKLVAKAESDMKRFLPGQKDSMKVEWNGELQQGSYTAVLSLVYAGTHVETRQVAFTIPARTASR